MKTAVALNLAFITFALLEPCFCFGHPTAQLVAETIDPNNPPFGSILKHKDGKDLARYGLDNGGILHINDLRTPDDHDTRIRLITLKNKSRSSNDVYQLRLAPGQEKQWALSTKGWTVDNEIKIGYHSSERSQRSYLGNMGGKTVAQLEEEAARNRAEAMAHYRTGDSSSGARSGWPH